MLKVVHPTALSNCPTLKKIIVSSGNINFKTLNDGLLYTKNESVLVVCPGGLENVDVRGSVSSFANSAFYGCSKLLSIDLEKASLSEISDSSFYGCVSLKEIYIPAKVGRIESNAFYGCSSLSVVTIADGSDLIKIGSGSFTRCTLLSKITFTGKSKLETIE